MCPIGFLRNNALPVTEVVEYDTKAGTRYALVRTGMDAPGHERWRTCDELVVTR